MEEGEEKQIRMRDGRGPFKGISFRLRWDPDPETVRWPSASGLLATLYKGRTSAWWRAAGGDGLDTQGVPMGRLHATHEMEGGDAFTPPPPSLAKLLKQRVKVPAALRRRGDE